MAIETLLLTILSTLLSPSEAPDEVRPDTKLLPNHFFCCDSVDSSGRGSGEGCVKMSEDHVNSCSDVLYCPGGWTKSEGTVRCTAATRREPLPVSKFCCDSVSVGDDGRKRGASCELVDVQVACEESSPLMCTSGWTKADGDVTCE